MCSILFSTKYSRDVDINKLNYYNQFRGPDDTCVSVDETNGFMFIHNLLSMTGEFTRQTFVDNNIICLYNGEVYNYKDFGNYNSDGECLIDLYKEYGKDFVKKLDGEFAILLLDFEKDIAIMATDPFKIKPLFYSTDSNEFGCSTYSTPLNILGYNNVLKAKPNTAMVFKLSDATLLDEFTIYKFNLNQHKTSFDDWNQAFKESIIKRTSNSSQKIFIGLSSGYDSGAICCELLKYNIPFKAYSVLGACDPRIIHENNAIINSRHLMISKSKTAEVETLWKKTELYNAHRDLVQRGTEEFIYTIESSSSNYKERRKLIDDRASSWLSLVCTHAINDGRKLYLSGLGADEIFSDYGFGGIKKTQHSNFGGLFPKDLSTIFPWNSFYFSSMESYLAKEEYVSGMHGVETRYPFLDKKVVQEFLWLDHNLKNSQYKSVLDNYFIENNYPFNRGEKKGF